MTKANISKSNKTKVAQSLEAFALPDDVKRENITHLDKKKSIVSAGGTWADFFAGPRLDDDFLNNRNQPEYSNSRLRERK
jgi:antitoxin VapB